MTRSKKTARILSAVLLLITAVLCLTHLTEIQMRWYLLTHRADFSAIERGFDAVKGRSSDKLVYSGGSFEIDFTGQVTADEEMTRAMERVTGRFGRDWAFYLDYSVFVLAGEHPVKDSGGKVMSCYFRLTDGRWSVCRRVHYAG